MYLSRVLLDMYNRSTMKAIASPHIMHGAIESSFPWKDDGKRRRVLWRIDQLAEKRYLLLLSEVEPDLAVIVDQFGYPELEPKGESRNYLALLNRLHPGQYWRFRLRANPVRSSFQSLNEHNTRGKVYAHVTPEQQKKWLLDRAEACGFAIEAKDVEVLHSEWKKFKKKADSSHNVSLRTADFEGVLSIIDVDRFKNTLITGLGKSKAYGCGMLTIMRIEGNSTNER